MRFDQPNDPQREARERLEAESWLDRNRVEEDLKHGRGFFRCLNCGSRPMVPWCQLCGHGMAA